MYGTKRHKLPEYPADHLLGMRVPNGGSNCDKCEYVNGQKCKQKQFIAWDGGWATPSKPKDSNVIPLDVKVYCCDFFTEK